jgi:hypothetical protein
MGYLREETDEVLDDLLPLLRRQAGPEGLRPDGHGSRLDGPDL